MEINILDYLSITYIICVTLITYFVLLVAINTKKIFVKIAINIIVGLIVAIIYHYFKITALESLFTSFVTSVVLYEWCVKFILEKFNITTKNNIGIKV